MAPEAAHRRAGAMHLRHLDAVGVRAAAVVQRAPQVAELVAAYVLDAVGAAEHALVAFGALFAVLDEAGRLPDAEQRRGEVGRLGAAARLAEPDREAG